MGCSICGYHKPKETADNVPWKVILTHVQNEIQDEITVFTYEEFCIQRTLKSNAAMLACVYQKDIKQLMNIRKTLSFLKAIDQSLSSVRMLISLSSGKNLDIHRSVSSLLALMQSGNLMFQNKRVTSLITNIIEHLPIEYINSIKHSYSYTDEYTETLDDVVSDICYDMSINKNELPVI